jgi:diguanylate cyclase (GGDEF)-like protein/PAS domain S-box-containing protein
MGTVKVLLVSPSDLQAELRSTSLWRKGGLERIAASTVSDAMKAALEHRPGLVLIALPDLTEVEVLARGLRSDPRTRATAIAILDCGFGPAGEATLVRAGVNVILPVPVDPFLWDRRLEELLTVPARRDERIAVKLEDWSRFLRESQQLEGAVINIGVRGVLLEAAWHFELGAKLGLTFSLPGDPEEVRVVGQVSRQAGSEGGLYRCGVEFLIYRGNARKRIADFVEAAPRRAGAPASALALSVKGLAEGGEWEEELRASELRKAVILDSALDPIVTFDHEGKIVEFNNAARRVFGYSRDEVVGREVAEKIVPPSLRDELRRRLREFVETGEAHGELGRRIEATAMRADGTELPVEVAVFPAYVKGRVLLTAFLRDLSERKTIEVERARVLNALRESETRITRITEAIPGAVFQFRIGPDGRALFPFVSRGASELVGVPPGDLQGGFDVWSLVHEEDRPRLVRSIQISARDLTPWNEVFRVTTRGGLKWIRGESLPTRESDRATVWNGIFFDVSEQKAAQEQLERLNQDLDRRLVDLRQAEAELQRLARYDSLTSLANRPFFLETLAQVLLRAERRKTRVGLIFMDLDGFKTVNDNLGHEAGDQLLRTVAERIRRSTRRTDSVARIGGDEFTVLLQDLERGDDAALAAQSVLDELVRPCTIGDRVVPVSASAGIAVYPEDGRDGQSLLRHADLAMYRAKQEGKSTYRFFTPAMGQRAHERMLLLSSLKRGLERGEFALRYQPVIRRSGPPVTIEALVRWEHPETGEITPDRFLQTAEESGLILPLGAFVLRAACRFAQSLGRPDVRVAVNLSARQFLQPDAVALVESALQETGLAPERLEIEVTEPAVMNEVEEASARLRRLREVGVELSLDDFGTGYSSLVHLKRFRFNRIKIDRSFVRDLPDDPDNAALVSAMMAMAQGLGLEVVAEGVETREQLAFLEAKGCRFFQGFLLCPPLEPAAVEPFLASYRGF